MRIERHTAYSAEGHPRLTSMKTKVHVRSLSRIGHHVADAVLKLSNGFETDGQP